MPNAPVIHVEDAELAERIANSAALGTPMRAEVDGQTYVLRVIRENQHEDIWANYDPEKVLVALNKYAGTWANPDADEMIANLYRAREEGTRPADRPRPLSPKPTS